MRHIALGSLLLLAASCQTSLGDMPGDRGADAAPADDDVPPGADASP